MRKKKKKKKERKGKRIIYHKSLTVPSTKSNPLENISMLKTNKS